jgi:hypothetical protein
MYQNRPIGIANDCLGRMLLVGAVTLFASPALAAENAASEATQDPAPRAPAIAVPETKAQSGAAAADEARIFTARLRHCEELPGAQRDACVELARKRLGQM